MKLPETFTILIVDDEEEMCLSLGEILEVNRYKSLYTRDPACILPLLEKQPVDLMIMDIKMPGACGIDILKIIKARYPDLPVIMITGHASIENAVSAMKFGALNFYTKPLQISALLHEIQQVARTVGAKNGFSNRTRMVGENRLIKEVIYEIKKVAPADVAVLITGESGTGKELAALSLHQYSLRKDAPFIKINCASIPETLLESELFGHEKGAFTDAKKQHPGLFERADGGSVFLDEIGDMNINTQPKLLRVLQDGKISRLGGTEVIDTNVRLISATNKDPAAAIKAGTFREDLFYRLSVITIELPPLRKRKDDLELLTSCFLNHFNSRYNKKVTGVSGEVKSIFMNHSWPGNIRELKNCLERAVIFAEGDTVEREHLSGQYRELDSGTAVKPIEDAYEQVSKEKIIEALSSANGIKQKAADLLKIHRKTLYNKMKKLGLE